MDNNGLYRLGGSKMFYTAVCCEKSGRIDMIAYATGAAHTRSLVRKKGWSIGRKNGELYDRTLCPNTEGGRKNAE